mgnify:CR=1 FL=1
MRCVWASEEYIKKEKIMGDKIISSVVQMVSIEKKQKVKQNREKAMIYVENYGVEVELQMVTRFVFSLVVERKVRLHFC